MPYKQDYKQTYLNTRIRNRPYRMWNSARQRARKAGIEFTITREWVEQHLQAGICEVTAIPFDTEYQRIWSPSLDRTDNSLGYTPENTKVVCFIYNAAKNSGTHADVLRFASSLIAMNDNSNGTNTAA